MRCEMVTLLSLLKELLSPGKKACLDDSSHSAKTQFSLYQVRISFFLILTRISLSYLHEGDQFPATYIPSGSLELRLVELMARNPASPMAQGHVCKHSAEGNFELVLQNIK